jgi:hypothetical protein
MNLFLTKQWFQLKKHAFTKINKIYINKKNDFKLEKHMFCTYFKWLTFLTKKNIVL